MDIRIGHGSSGEKPRRSSANETDRVEDRSDQKNNAGQSKSARQKSPVMYPPIQRELRNLAASNPTKARLKKETDDVQADLDTWIELLANKKEQFSVDTFTELKNRFENLGTAPQKYLQRKFRNADDDKKQIILDLLLRYGGGFSDFVGKKLEQGKGKHYDLCMEFLTSLDENRLNQFVYHADYSSGLKVNNLAKALLEIARQAGENDHYVLDLLDSACKALTIDKDDMLEKKQELTLAVMKNMDGELTSDDMFEQYERAPSLNLLSDVSGVLKKRFKNWKEVLASFVTYEGLSNAKRGQIAIHYAKLVGEHTIPLLREQLLDNFDDPSLVTPLCTALAYTHTDKGREAIIDVIEEVLDKGNPSLVLATVAFLSRNSTIFEPVIESIFSSSELDVHQAFMDIHDSSLRVFTMPSSNLKHTKKKPSLPYLVSKIGLDDRFSTWITDTKNVTLRDNASRVLLTAIRMGNNKFDEHLSEFLSDGQRSRKLRKLIGIS